MALRSRLGARARLGLVVALALTAGACPANDSSDPPTTQATPRPTTPTNVAPPLDALFAGCTQVYEGPRCAFVPGETSLRLWVDIEPSAPLQVLMDGTPLPPESVTVEAAEGGQRITLRPNATHRQLGLRSTDTEFPGVFMLELSPETPRRSDALIELDTKLSEGRPLSAVREQLSALLPTLEGRDRLDGLRLAASLALQADDYETAVQWFDEAVGAAQAQGRPSDASRLAQTAAWVELARRYDTERARAWLERESSMAPHDPEQRLTRAHYRGLLDQRTGDFRAARLAFEDQARLARALGMPRLESAALSELLLLMGRLGAHEDAAQLERRAIELATVLTPLERAQLLNSAGWMRLEARGRGFPADDPTPLLRHANEALSPDEPAHAAMRGVLALNLSYASVLDGDPTAAQRWLDAAEGAPLAHGERQWQRLLRARLVAAQGRTAPAIELYDAIMAEAARDEDPELHWQALVGRAYAQRHGGRVDDAIASYREAEQLLDAQLPRIALTGGRGRFVAERDAATRQVVQLLRQANRVDEALCAARLARTRALRVVERQLRKKNQLDEPQRRRLERYLGTRQRLEAQLDESWSLPLLAGQRVRRSLQRQRQDAERQLDALMAELDPRSDAGSPTCDALRTPSPERVDLYYFEAAGSVPDRRTFIAFTQRGDETAVHDLGPGAAPSPDAPPSAWASYLLDPIRTRLEADVPIRIVASGPLLEVPIHALPVDDDGTTRLIDTAEVVYGLDLPLRSRPPSEGDALIVAPPSNLSYAEPEVVAVGRALGQRGWTTQVLRGARATASDLRQRLVSAQWFHYVGHAASAGPGGWDSALTMARDSTLRVTDVLALASVPTTVVLDGCETGANDPRALAGGMSLAHAFMVAGSETVIATTKQVDDADAAALMQRVYAALASPAHPTASAALRRAQRAREASEQAWKHTRVWQQ